MALLLKRALGIGALAYIVSLLIGMVVAVLTGVDPERSLPSIVLYISIATSFLIYGAAAYLYFAKGEPGAMPGLALGGIFVAVSFALDLIIVVPTLLLSGSQVNVLQYYLEPLFWASVLAILAASALVGWLRGRSAAASA